MEVKNDLAPRITRQAVIPIPIETQQAVRAAGVKPAGKTTISEWDVQGVMVYQEETDDVRPELTPQQLSERIRQARSTTLSLSQDEQHDLRRKWESSTNYLGKSSGNKDFDLLLSQESLQQRLESRLVEIGKQS